MDEKPPLPSTQVRWDLEGQQSQQSQPAARPGLQRSRSRGSMSIHSVRSNSGVDPAAALPIQYRTVWVVLKLVAGCGVADRVSFHPAPLTLTTTTVRPNSRRRPRRAQPLVCSSPL